MLALNRKTGAMDEEMQGNAENGKLSGEEKTATAK